MISGLNFKRRARTHGHTLTACITGEASIKLAIDSTGPGPAVGEELVARAGFDKRFRRGGGSPHAWPPYY
jgi:hypothetical protein